ncbi:MAG: formylmethanofuran dehydrogenase subunit C [Methylothermaceae bacterium]|nr:formylmethanofuran dehydrogenase subunit C [Methylothermaceae bacterium]
MLTLTLKAEPKQRVDLSPLSGAPHLTVAEIAALKVWSGKKTLRMDELFRIEGEDTSRWVIRNAHAKLDCIGKDGKDLDITVEGDAGAYLGMGLRSGRIRVTGNADLFAGCEMRGGLIQIDGNAGDFLGAALPGNKRGMRGGIVLVKGSAGDRLGDEMRRGIILVEGDAGDYCASRMIAGTVAVMGSTGRYLGYGLKRGTVLLWQQPAEMLPTFGDCGTHTLAYLPLWFASLSDLDSRFAASEVVFKRVRRYGGDLASVGRGEILIRSAGA